MKKHLLLSCILAGCVGVAAAAEKEKKSSAQGEKMKICSAEAKAQALKGDARKAFMSSCLKKKPAG